MTTQEKLVMELVDEICDYDEYCSDENCNKCGGAIKYWKKKLNTLIDSAKREGAIDELTRLDIAAHSDDYKVDVVYFDEAAYIRNRLPQLEQSEESV